MHVHGRGNAWPVPLGGNHPFYDRNDYRDLSNAAFSLTASGQGRILDHVLIDAGHGTVQGLLSGMNRIPDCICLTHGHMDHTLSVDWIVQSYRRQREKSPLYPVYATAPVCRSLCRSYPHLEKLMECRELIPGETLSLGDSGTLQLTTYPAYHGPGAAGASMLLFERGGRRVLFTGDLLSPLLREADYERLKGVDLLVVDANNRYPWPRTNHWSFAGDSADPTERNSVLKTFIGGLTWEELAYPHELQSAGESARDYFRQLKEDWNPATQPFTILEFLPRIEPGLVLPVHYSGAEDARHHHEAILDGEGLLSWISLILHSRGITSACRIPEPGQVIPL